MPFGFDPVEAEKYVNEVKDTVNRIYIDVTVRWLPTGKMIPLSFTWEDGREYKINKVLAVREGHSLKQFASGKRYYCQTGKRRYYLHYDGERWYVEVKGPPR
jgi:hypothetical protein